LLAAAKPEAPRSENVTAIAPGAGERLTGVGHDRDLEIDAATASRLGSARGPLSAVVDYTAWTVGTVDGKMAQASTKERAGTRR
jgi:hypothetical protein